jgi:hypothetical protein
MSNTSPAIQRRVVCSAIRNSSGELILGARHYDSQMRTSIESHKDGKSFHHRNGKDQGFIDQWNVYMDRKEAYKVAEAAGQILHPEHCTNRELYSEGLY